MLRTTARVRLTLHRFSLLNIWQLGFSVNPSVNPSRGAATIRRAGTIVRSPLDRKDRDKHTDGDLPAADVRRAYLFFSL